MLQKEGNEQRLIFYLKHTLHTHTLSRLIFYLKHTLHTHTLSLSLSLSQFSMALSLPISSLESDIKTKNSGCPESEIGSQGLRKQILKKGNSWQTPFPGDEVEGTYSIPFPCL